jgi:hypothetical protein
VTREQRDQQVRRIVTAMRSIEFNARHCRASFTGTAGAPLDVARVEVRHPIPAKDGTNRLVGVVALEPEPRVAYVVPMYEDAIRRMLARALNGGGS